MNGIRLFAACFVVALFWMPHAAGAAPRTLMQACVSETTVQSFCNCIVPAVAKDIPRLGPSEIAWLRKAAVYPTDTVSQFWQAWEFTALIDKSVKARMHHCSPNGGLSSG